MNHFSIESHFWKANKIRNEVSTIGEIQLVLDFESNITGPFFWTCDAHKYRNALSLLCEIFPKMVYSHLTHV